MLPLETISKQIKIIKGLFELTLNEKQTISIYEQMKQINNQLNCYNETREIKKMKKEVDTFLENNFILEYVII